MLKYIGKRILMMLPILFGITVIVFTLMYVTPGDPAYAILGENATPEQVAEIHEEYGLDDPYFVRLGRYFAGILHGDFGTSYKTGQPVFREIMTRYPNTLKLALLSTLLGVIIGVTCGIVSAVKQYSVFDKIGTVVSLFGASAPSFWIAMVLVLFFAVKLKWLPPTGTYGFKY